MPVGRLPRVESAAIVVDGDVDRLTIPRVRRNPYLPWRGVLDGIGNSLEQNALDREHGGRFEGFDLRKLAHFPHKPGARRSNKRLEPVPQFAEDNAQIALGGLESIDGDAQFLERLGDATLELVRFRRTRLRVSQ